MTTFEREHAARHRRPPAHGRIVGLDGLRGLSALYVAAGDRIRRLPWHWLAAAAAAPIGYLILRNGSVWTVHHYFWIDLAIAPAMAMILAAVATGRPAALAAVRPRAKGAEAVPTG